MAASAWSYDVARLEPERAWRFETRQITQRQRRACEVTVASCFGVMLAVGERRPQASQFFLSISFCMLLPISIKRRQTFSRNETTLSTSASLIDMIGQKGPPALRWRPTAVHIACDRRLRD